MDKGENIVVSNTGFSVHVLKNYHENVKEKIIHDYNYDLFKIVIPEGPYCSKHEILTKEEVIKQLEELHKVPRNLEKIKSKDPQIFWIGAKPGHIVRITRDSTIAGEAINYRLVTE